MRREEKRKGDGEEVKMSEGREGREIMKMMHLKKTQKHRSIGKKWLLHVEISKIYYVFQ